MEIQFEQNKNFNQSHRDEPTVTKTTENDKGKPQGREGDPNFRMVTTESENDEKNLDRRPADVVNENINSDESDDTSSAIPGIQSDLQNTTRHPSKPLGEDPNVNAERENKEETGERKKESSDE